MQPINAKHTLWQCNSKNISKMAKTLRVISPFFVMEAGDTFEYDKVADMFISEHSEEFHKADDENSEVRSTYNSNFAISKQYAKDLMLDGYLEEVTEDGTKSFVNVFDEIETLTNKYTSELKNLNEDMATFPECMRVERTTVLNNLLSLLDHLKGLKK